MILPKEIEVMDAVDHLAPYRISRRSSEGDGKGKEKGASKGTQSFRKDKSACVSPIHKEQCQQNRQAITVGSKYGDSCASCIHQRLVGTRTQEVVLDPLLNKY